MSFKAPIELNYGGSVSNITYSGQNVKLSGKAFADVVTEKQFKRKDNVELTADKDIRYADREVRSLASEG